MGGWETGGGEGDVTLPASMGDNRHAAVDQVAEGEQGGLDGALHGADQDEADVEVLGDAGAEVGFEIGALLPAEGGERGVVDAVVLWRAVRGKGR